jgi:hypothetical protein
LDLLELGDGGGMACNPTANAVAGRLITWTSSRSGAGQMVQGLVPDGVTEVTLITANGSTTTARVSDNAYGADLSGSLARVRIGGETVLSLGGPDQ